MPDEEIGSTRSLVAILFLARHFFLGISNAEDPTWAKLRKPVLEELGIAKDGDGEYFAEISEQFHERS
jgi:hypothetical protein